MSKVDTVLQQLSAGGCLSEKLSGFKVRQEQLDMAAQVVAAIEAQGCAVIEAGTGTGKTFAYLVPALMLGKKVVISTGTRNLQNQLFHKDLPLVRACLQQPLVTALLKGRSNYLCSYRLEQHRFIKHMLSSYQSRQLAKIELWAQSTKRGDISELAELPESDPVWGYATSSVDNCLGTDCPYIDKCHLNKARQEALKADVVVINHHLFFADAIMREEGFGELLPNADLIILDEAHQLVETASRFFGMSLSSRKVKRICSDLEAEVRESAADMQSLLDQVAEVVVAIDKIQQVLSAAGIPEKGAWQEISSLEGLVDAVSQLGDELFALDELVEMAEGRSRGLQNCQRRLAELLALYRTIAAASSRQDNARRDVSVEAQVEAQADDALEAGLSGYVQWYERYRNSFIIHLTPLSVEEAFSLYREQFKAAWVFTSATLSVNNRFDSFVRPLGLLPTHQLQLASPFDYATQACLYVPTALPDPRDQQFTAAIVEMAVPLLQKTQGRAFMLFTSHAALQEAAKLIAGRLEYPILVQGEMNKSELLNQFKSSGNAVLLATGDFWEGVDVRGSALSCVIIDKLPFASPGEPVVKAKIDHVRAQGGNPFMDYQVPAAVIGLKQGVGRLIRDVEDRGLLVICDNRLVNSRYGALFLRSLPPMPLTREWDEVVHFVDQHLAVDWGSSDNRSSEPDSTNDAGICTEFEEEAF